MAEKNLPSIGGKSFEDLKQSNEFGAEYWSARDLQPLLGYSQWRRFEDAIKRAMTSCEQSGNQPAHHFAGAGKPIPGGKGMQGRSPQTISNPGFHQSHHLTVPGNVAYSCGNNTRHASDSSAPRRVFLCP